MHKSENRGHPFMHQRSSLQKIIYTGVVKKCGDNKLKSVNGAALISIS